MSTHPQNPPPLARPIRRRPAASPPPQIQPSKLSSNIPSLSAVRRTLFHSSSSSSRLHARAASQAHQQIQQSQQQQYPPAPMNAPPVVVKDACLRGEGEEIVERDAQGGVLMEGVLNMGVFPRDERMEEDSGKQKLSCRASKKF
ncbi:hypothetical protein BT63DRAFT_424949 [Microthyrium microscopicum]|uniref:Uncharacterized protein n=1 Tax=Microthyrium microscopicum TaxID=703497 RepID=A0A6A6UAD5_9PEZI|nr:hypothetical protein BT63DRAFT_424949 [Microthyrium microscopicum]